MIWVIEIHLEFGTWDLVLIPNSQSKEFNSPDNTATIQILRA